MRDGNAGVYVDGAPKPGWKIVVPEVSALGRLAKRQIHGKSISIPGGDPY